MSTIKAYTDGACRGNSGPGGAGAIIFYPETTQEISEYVGRKTTNNVAEYTAVILALENIKKRGVKEDERIAIYTDSDLIVKQMHGVWKCNKPHLIELKNKLVIISIKAIESRILVIDDSTIILTKSLIKTDKPEILISFLLLVDLIF